jgi:hypothetical protein
MIAPTAQGDGYELPEGPRISPTLADGSIDLSDYGSLGLIVEFLTGHRRRVLEDIGIFGDPERPKGFEESSPHHLTTIGPA